MKTKNNDFQHFDLEEYKKNLFSERPDIKEKYDSLELKYKLIEALIEYRIKHNLTQKEIAEKVGLKQQAISKFERGLVNPRIDFVSKIITSLGLEIDIRDTSKI